MRPNGAEVVDSQGTPIKLGDKLASSQYPHHHTATVTEITDTGYVRVLLSGPHTKRMKVPHADLPCCKDRRVRSASSRCCCDGILLTFDQFRNTLWIKLSESNQQLDSSFKS